MSNSAANASGGRPCASYADFKSTTRFDSLQQLRTVSVLMVLASHMQDPIWYEARLFLGVQVFFVISGFLITTLLLREEERNGSVSLRGFYTRRAFRILPVYYVALALFAIPILGFGIGGQREEFIDALPYYLTYQNDFAASAPFGHTWSLAIEEKFYLLWPILILAVSFTRRHRMTLAIVLFALTCASQYLGYEYPALYTPILAGCIVALTLHSSNGHRVTTWIRTPWSTVAFLISAVLAIPFESKESTSGHAVFAILTALALAGIVTNRGKLEAAFSVAALVRLGTYSYAFYLLHPLVKSCFDLIIENGQTGAALAVLRFLIVAALTFAASIFVYRTVERPLILKGRKLSGAGALR